MTTISTWTTRAAVAVLAAMPVLANAQAQGCGTPGTTPCPLPEPSSWPLVALALGVMVAVRFIRRK